MNAATVTVNNVTDLINAIATATAGDEVQISSETYDISRDMVTTHSGQAGWYLFIDKSIKLIGIWIPVLTSFTVCLNGSCSTQNLITVDADNVTIDGLIIENKVDGNKTIEVLGKIFNLKNITTRGNTLVTQTNYNIAKGISTNDPTDWLSFYQSDAYGNIYFSCPDAGSAVVESVTVKKGFIAAPAVSVIA